MGKIKDHFVIICFNITCLVPGGSLSWSGPSLIMVSLGFRGAATHTHSCFGEYESLRRLPVVSLATALGASSALSSRYHLCPSHSFPTCSSDCVRQAVCPVEDQALTTRPPSSPVNSWFSLPALGLSAFPHCP